jgi:hypothetical protein
MSCTVTLGAVPDEVIVKLPAIVTRVIRFSQVLAETSVVLTA